jgi:signal transduction histidine kinase
MVLTVRPEPAADSGAVALKNDVRALGDALMARVDDCWRTCEERLQKVHLAEQGSTDVGTPEFRARRRANQKLGVELIARYLQTGVESSPEERKYLGELGELAARTGVSILNMTRGYLMFRDVVGDLLKTEAARLGTAPAALAHAQLMNTRSCEASILWMTHKYDLQLEQQVVEERRLHAELAAFEAESEAKNRFLATMSHELRTPLNSILGFAQLLGSQGGKLDERQKRYLNNIESSGKHLLALISDILELSRIAAGKVELAIEEVEVATVIREVASELEPMVSNQPVKLELRLEPGLHASVDERGFRQVMVNLVANSLKFTEEGAVTITSCAGDRQVEVRVVDTGIGIPADQMERVFEEFTQVDSGSTRTRGGTGLGLPLSRRLVELMGGTLTLASQLGTGTTATVRLPASG